MFCKNCGTENQDDSPRCVSCGTYLKLTDSPLNGGERVQVIVFFILILFPFFMLFGGIVITLIALGSIYIMKKDKSFSPIQNAQKYIKTYLIILAIGATALVSVAYYHDNKHTYDYSQDYMSDNYIKDNQNINTETALVAGAGVVLTPIAVMLFMGIFNALFFRPMEEHKNWIIKHGIFSDKPNETSILGSAREKIQTFQNPQSGSVADELLKWKSLLDQGVITNEEFNERKEKLLK
jgi:hypothetical protein